MAAIPCLILAERVRRRAGQLFCKKTASENVSRLSRKHSTTILMVTHDALSASHCDRILFIREGEISAPSNRGKESRQEFIAGIPEVMTRMDGGKGMYPERMPRSAKRSVGDCPMYILSMAVLSSDMCITDCSTN